MSETRGIRVAAINRQVVKGTHAETMGCIIAEVAGGKHDHELGIIDSRLTDREKRPWILTQRQVPSLATIRSVVDEANRLVRLTSPRVNELLVIDLEQNGADLFPASINGLREVVVVEKICKAGSEWLEVALDRKGVLYKLVSPAPSYTRRAAITTPPYPEYDMSWAQARLHDQSPYHLVSRPTVNWLNELLLDPSQGPIGIDRFRPTIEIEGGLPNIEDEYSGVIINGVYFHLAAPCTRCAVTQVNQETGKKAGKEPIPTLSKYKKVPAGVLFGWYLLLDPSRSENRSFEIGENDQVEYVGKRPSPVIPSGSEQA